MTKTSKAGTESRRHALSREMKVADLIDLNFHLIGILSRMGLRLGFGESTVEDMCRKAGVDVGTFLLICNVYTFCDYSPSAETLRGVKLADVLRYLHLSHVYYVDKSLVTLQLAIEKLLSPCEERHKKVIRKFYTDYKEELEKHFEFEEKEVFPYVEGLLKGETAADSSMSRFEEGHSNIEEKISDLKNIVMKYLPPQCAPEDIQEVLFYIYYLKNDLERHTSIEDMVLLPLIDRLEENGKQQ